MRFYLLALLLGLSVSATAADKLFASEDILSLTLQGPFSQMLEERDLDQIYSSAQVTYQEGENEVSVPVELQVRGKSRLRQSMCAFPPLRVIVDKKTADGTLFEKQKKLKLVTQCRPRYKIYEQYVLAEYLIYKSLNLLTANSYQVRLASIDYVDESGEKLHSNYGFFLEATKRVGKRIDRKRLKLTETDATRLNSEHLNLISLFQFMVGNVDWSATHGGSEECCHNGKLFGEAEGSDNLYIPYDFDMTGLVDPEYGKTPPELKLEDIRDRRYRGYCRNNQYLDQNIALFNQHKDEIIDLFQSSELLLNSAKRKRVSYLNRFYKIINNPKRVERTIHKWCHESKMVAVDQASETDVSVAQLE